MKVVASNLAAFGMPEENFVVDLTIARGLDYYTTYSCHMQIFIISL